MRSLLAKQLREKYFRFLLVKPKEKVPLEKNWQEKNNYTFGSTKINNHISFGGNVGIIAGIGGLGILDDDTPDKLLLKLYDEHFPKTFRVRDHYYIKLKGWDGKKIVLDEQETKTHLGELQGDRTQCVTYPSIHPSGERYEVKHNCPIAEIEFEDFIKVFGKYRKVKKIHTLDQSGHRTEWKGDDIKDIPISSIISTGALSGSTGGNLQGPHPVHGSEGGKNFSVDQVANTWYCHRCSSGGGPSELIAVVEGVISCSQAGPNCYTKDEAQEVIKHARDKYGLTTPEENNDYTPVQAVIDNPISGIAQKYNYNNCHKCHSKFTFKDSKGFFYCEGCKRGGTQKVFIQEIIDNS